MVIWIPTFMLTAMLTAIQDNDVTALWMMLQNHLIPSSKDLLTFLFLNNITKLWHYQKQCQCYMKLCKKKHDIQKITDCIRSNSEKRDSENKHKICAQIIKPTFRETTIIFL